MIDQREAAREKPMSIAVPGPSGPPPGVRMAPAGRRDPRGSRAPRRLRESSTRAPRCAGAGVVAPIPAITLCFDGRAPHRAMSSWRRRHARDRGPERDLSMSNSGGSGKFAWETSKGEAAGAQPRDDWPATRAEPASTGSDRRMAGRPGCNRAAGAEEWQPTRAHGSAVPRSDEKWQPSAPPRGAPGPAESPDAWASTRAHTALATQLHPDENDYLAGEKDEIGRQIGGNERELFVSCAPAEALQQQFDHLQPEFIAVHDIATSSSRKLLAGIAAASGRAVQKLVIRRQGYGTALATLEFVDLPTTDNQSLRLYTTEADADSASRHALAKALLANSRLGVIMVGELPGPCDRLGAEAGARRHPGRPLAEPQPAAAAARLGQHPGHARPRSRPRHRRRGADDAAGRPARRCLGLHHRHLEPAARADPVRRRPQRARARRLQAGGVPAAQGADGTGDRAAFPRATRCRWRISRRSR